ncbi:MAG: HAD family hydrolase [Phycisphaerales bacterium JB061]
MSDISKIASRIEAVTFDCFGTLIDWESGILGVLKLLCERYSVKPAPADTDLLAMYARLEGQAEHGAYRPYREILAEVMQKLAGELGFQLASADRSLLADSIEDWPAFSDTAASLRALKARYKVGVLSNIDDDLFEGALPKLGLGSVGGLDLLVTAQQVESYKPAYAHFEEALRRLGIDKSGLLHIAQSQRHDVQPCNELGIRCVWVDRRRGSGGASGDFAAQPDFVVPDLATLVRELGLSS